MVGVVHTIVVSRMLLSWVHSCNPNPGLTVLIDFQCAAFCYLTLFSCFTQIYFKLLSSAMSNRQTTKEVI